MRILAIVAILLILSIFTGCAATPHMGVSIQYKDVRVEFTPQ